MKILAISKEIHPVDWESQHDTLQEEARTLHKLYLEDLVREFYFTDDGEAVLILECGSKDQAHWILARLPLVEKGLIGFEIMELHPYTGFSRIIHEP